MTKLVQISREKGVLRRVAKDAKPVIELALEDGQYVADVEWSRMEHGSRKTVDWHWSATVVTPLETK